MCIVQLRQIDLCIGFAVLRYTSSFVYCRRYTKSIPEIDQQLYAKYGLDEKEIAFIKEKVKAME